MAGFSNSGIDLMAAIRAPSPFCTLSRPPANALLIALAPPPYPDLLVLDSAMGVPRAPSALMAAALAGMGGLSPFEGFLPDKARGA